ncbi:hypothetical protein PYJP_09520 [Pyrofollis japonicus]|nr:hypothetical protein PYJP_09520 [Pyrofollis japonicus]
MDKLGFSRFADSLLKQKNHKLTNMTINLNDIIDAELHDDAIYLVTVSGKIIRINITPQTRELYWQIKIRNRRKAFGI